MHVSDRKVWSQDPPLPRPYLRVDSGGEGIMMETLMYLRPSEGEQLLSLISGAIAVVLEQILTCCGLGPCCSVVIATPSITLQGCKLKLIQRNKVTATKCSQ